MKLIFLLMDEFDCISYNQIYIKALYYGRGCILSKLNVLSVEKELLTNYLTVSIPFKQLERWNSGRLIVQYPFKSLIHFVYFGGRTMGTKYPVLSEMNLSNQAAFCVYS